MEECNTSKGTYEMIKLLDKTYQFVGEYKYLFDGNNIEGYERNDLKEYYNDPFVPIVKINCNNGWIITTNYKNQIKNMLN